MNSPLYGRFRVSQIYKGESHKGIDLVGIDSKEVHSTVDGVVEVARWDSRVGAAGTDPSYGMGQYIRIRENESSYRHYFAHLSQMLASPGQKVRKGDIIGIEGSSGHATGSHVHYEIRKTTATSSFLNVSELSGIPNQLGTYTQDDSDNKPELEAARKIVQEKAGLNDNTMKYLEEYQYGEDLIRKLAEAMS